MAFRLPEVGRENLRSTIEASCTQREVGQYLPSSSKCVLAPAAAMLVSRRYRRFRRYPSRSKARRTGRLLAPSTPATSSALPGGCRLPLPGVGCAHDDAKPVGATAASQRQVDQRHVAMSTGHQAREVKPDGVLAGARPGRHV
jgi:hypothetical protein